MLGDDTEDKSNKILVHKDNVPATGDFACEPQGQSEWYLLVYRFSNKCKFLAATSSHFATEGPEIEAVLNNMPIRTLTNKTGDVIENHVIALSQY